MQIIWHGQSCFELISAQGKGSQVVLVVDPFDEETGLRLPKLEADVVLVTHDHHDHNNVKAVQPVPGSQGEPILIDGPGEYDIKGVFVRGIPSWHDQANGKEKGANTIFVIETEDLKICHLGDLGQKELTTDQVEQIGEVDVLLMPVGGVYTISSKEAVKIMAQIEPAITIPMHYQLPKDETRRFGSVFKNGRIEEDRTAQ
jgi:L-ascorbate metabolism protein UlaG (beta-lactamase superfamily)